MMTLHRKTDKLQGMDMRVDPARQILAAAGFGKGVTAGAQHGEK
jgi:hypothetical protein